MATFELPAEPTANRVWLLTHRLYRDAGPFIAMRLDFPPPIIWRVQLPGGDTSDYTWDGLLAQGPVSDVDPDDTSWLGDMLAFPLRAVGADIYDRDQTFVHTVDGPWAHEHDAPFATLIARLVNEHVARNGEKPES